MTENMHNEAGEEGLPRSHRLLQRYGFAKGLIESLKSNGQTGIDGSHGDLTVRKSV